MKAKNVRAHERYLERRDVFEGRREKTSGGLRQDDLMLNSRGRVVSRAKNAQGKKIYKTNPIVRQKLQAEQAKLQMKCSKGQRCGKACISKKKKCLKK